MQRNRTRLPRISGASTATRFWAKVDQSGDCWEWLGSTGPKGYGKFWLDGGCAIAHRVAYELVYGPIPDGLMVLHSCDNPPCVNPAHLSVGTNSDNQRESVERRRHASANRPSNCRKLTIEQVHEIRDRLASGETQLSIAQSFGVSKSAICLIKNNRNWSRF